MMPILKMFPHIVAMCEYLDSVIAEDKNQLVTQGAYEYFFFVYFAAFVTGVVVELYIVCLLRFWLS